MKLGVRVAGLLIAAALLAVIGWRLMCTTFMIHDDEGYVLISLRNFAEHGRLYDEVFTQYGPAPFLYYHALHTLTGLPIDSWLGRIMAMVHWLGIATAAGLLAWRLSGRYWTALFTLVAVFGYLWQMTWEPAHPGGLIACIAAAALAAAVEAWHRNRPTLSLAVLGTAGAALLFTKINVGLLWCCAAGAFLLLETGGGLRGRGPWLAAAGLALLPFALMRPLLGEPWVLKLAIMNALAGVALCLPVNPSHEPALRGRHWFVAGAGLAGLGAIIVIATIANGTGLAALVRGVLLDPLRHPVNFHLGFTWDNLSWLLQAVVLAACALWCLLPAHRPRLRDAIAGLRLLALAGFIWKLEAWLSVEGLGGLIRYGLPLAPLFLIPLADPPAGDRRWPAVRLAALVGTTQVLHAYPVSGSQMAWGSFLLVPVAMYGIAGAVAHCVGRWQRAWPQIAVATLALMAAASQAWLLFDQGNRRWEASEPLAVPGAEFLRPQENVRYALRIVTANARLHADVLFSRPGMFGFNLWTGVPTPTLRNTTHWFWLLSAADQQAIMDRLRAGARPVVISSRPVLDLLRDEMQVKVAGPLNDYINQEYRPLFMVTGYEFLVRKDSPAAPFFVAQNFHAPSPAATEPALVAVNLAVEAEVARVVLRDVRLPTRVLASWDQSNSQVALQAIDRTGQPQGAPRAAAWPVRLEGLQQLRIFHRSPLPPDGPDLELVFLDAAGRPLFEACYDLGATVSLPPAGG